MGNEYDYIYKKLRMGELKDGEFIKLIPHIDIWDENGKHRAVFEDDPMYAELNKHIERISKQRIKNTSSKG